MTEGETMEKTPRYYDCPFKVSKGAKAIVCTGFCKSMQNKLLFSSAEDSTKWHRYYCKNPEESGYEKCPYFILMAHMLDF